MRSVLLLAVLLLLTTAPPARACSCIAPDPERAEAVFVGRVAEVDGDRVVFDVERSLKGGYVGRVELPYVVGSSASCGAGLRAGQRTGVLIYGDEDAIGLCNLADPDDLRVAPPTPAALLGRLLGICWSAL